jgi:hypothetical protein
MAITAAAACQPSKRTFRIVYGHIRKTMLGNDLAPSQRQMLAAKYID